MNEEYGCIAVLKKNETATMIFLKETSLVVVIVHVSKFPK